MRPRPDLNPKQAEAVDAPAGDRCVMAGAGSGKTTVLCERFVTLVTRDADPRRVAALTFTEKAADEMRDRIAERFADPKGVGRVRDSARDVEFAPISTIHSFCARLLREHAVDAGIDPAFGLLDETAATLLLEDSYDAVERRWRRANDPRLAVLRLLGDEGAGAEVRSLLVRMRTAALRVSDARWRRGATSLAVAQSNLAAALARFDSVRATLRIAGDAGAALSEARALLPTPEALSTPSFATARVASALGDEDGAASLLPVPTPKPFAPLRAARTAVVVAYEAAARAIVDEIGVREVEGPLAALLLEVDAEYARRKDAASLLDFSDLEVRALALLRDQEAAGRFLEGAPTHLLVDEFQDTNPVQAAILDRLRSRASLFSVGDPKQSIYRFRGADVRGMLREWEGAGAQRRTHLVTTYRAKAGLVAFHNAVFGRLFAEGAGGIAYEPMEAHDGFHADVAEVAPEILIVDAGPKAGATARRMAEAHAIAERILLWCDGKTLLARRERGAGGAVVPPRPLRFRDVAVLMRSRTDVKVYERALLDAGIPFRVGRGRGFFRTEEVSDLLNFLRVVHDPDDRFAVAAWMTGPAVGATDGEVLLAFRSGLRPFDAVAGHARLGRAAEVVAVVRRLAASAPLEEVVAAAVEACGGKALALLQDGGVRRARNLEKAVAITRRLEADGRHGLSDYLRALTDLRDRDVEEPEAEAAVGGDDAVSLLTVHGAKGLEWPCVVLADAGRPPARFPPRWRMAEDGGFAWRLVDPFEGESIASGGYEELGEGDGLADDAEELRLLYVALTRAGERLLVTMSAEGATQQARPAGVRGWGGALWGLLGLEYPTESTSVALGDASVLVCVEEAGEGRVDVEKAPWFGRYGPEALAAGTGPRVPPALFAEARRLVERARRPVTTLGRTPFVVTISDLLRFAESPRRWYEDSHVLGSLGGAGALHAEPDDPGSGGEGGVEASDLDESRRDRGDEFDGPLDGIDRTALGRAVHLAIERYDPKGPGPDAQADEAVTAEFTGGVPAGAPALARAMLRRFLDCETGRATVEALRMGRDVRREVAFHARIRFPEGASVAGLDALLVKGTIDLWLAGEGGPLLVDHKTNSPRGRLSTVEAIREHYSWQLRLYALAAERVLGTDVRGARLLLLDPAWGGAPEVEVDVSGDRLLDARRLSLAFATASLEDRWPERWEELLR